MSAASCRLIRWSSERRFHHQPARHRGLAQREPGARHRRYLLAPEGHDVVVPLGGPTLEEETGAMNGTLLVVEVASIDAVCAFVADDAHGRAGLFAAVEIRPWRWGLGNRGADG